MRVPARRCARLKDRPKDRFDLMHNANIDLRVNSSFLADHERRVLRAIAARLPARCTPNGMTLFGVFGGCVVMLGYWLSRGHLAWLWLANFGLVIHWAGDSLDGTLARYRGIERPRYGFYLDQVIDALGNVMIALGVGFARAARLDLALFVLATFHMLSIQVYVRAIVDREFHLAVGRLGPTEMRLGIMIMNIGILVFGAPLWRIAGVALTWCDLLMLATGIGLLGLYGYQMRRHLERFAREDPRQA
jgi:phosphatidylglycerophosphate synthase